MPFSWAPVTVLRRHPEAVERVALGVKLDEDRRLGPRDPRVVSGLDRDDLRRHDLECTAVPVPPLHATAGEEADVRVHAVLRADSGSRARPSARPRAGAVERVLAVRLARFILASPVEPQRTAGTPRPRTRASDSGLNPSRTSWTPLSKHSRYARGSGRPRPRRR